MPIPDEHNVVARYPIVLLKAGAAAEAAQRFVGHVLSAQGRRVLQAHGFGVP